MFLYTKIQTLFKKQHNLCCVLKYKNSDTLRYAVFRLIFEIGVGGMGGYLQKTMHYVLHFYIQKTMHFALSFYV